MKKRSTSNKTSPSKKTRKPRPRKQTSDRVSSIAAKVLARLIDEPGRNQVFPLENGLGMIDAGQVICTVAELKALAASALGQDETRGKRKPGA